MSSCRQILIYDFKQVNSTIVADTSGNGHAGVIRNFDKGGATVSTVNIYGHSSNILSLPGGSDGGYLELPNGILKDSGSCTVSMFFRCHKCAERSTLFSIGTDNIFAVILEPVSDNSFNCHVMATSGGMSQAALSDGCIFAVNEWYFISASFDTMDNDNRISLYVNGIPKASLPQKRVSCLSIGDSCDNYIGFGPFSQSLLSADIADVSILPYAITETDAALLFSVSNQDRISFDIKELEFLSGICLEQDIDLPKIGTYGTSFEWSSSDEIAISKHGKITRPVAESEKKSAVLTLNASYESTSISFDFPIFVMPLPSASQILEKELEEIGIDTMMPIVSDLNLPSVLPSGGELIWTSSEPAIISTTGKVTRPILADNYRSAFTDITLTATAALDGTECIREFNLKVPGIPKKVKDCDKKVSAERTKPEDREDFVPAKHIKPRGYHVPIKDVSLGDNSIFFANLKRDLDYLRLLDCDRMLYNFRLTFGEDTKGAIPLGGWDEPSGLLRGHSTGHYLSALALSFASTKDALIKGKLDYMVKELNHLQSLSKGLAKDFNTSCTPTNASQSQWSKDPSVWGKGYLGAYPPDQFALLEQFTPYATIWAPYYTLHKILAGLIDCYTYADNAIALETAVLLGEWVENRLSHTTKEQRDKMWSMYIAGEYGGMNESLAALSIITGRDDFLKTAKMFDNPKLFDGLSVNMDTISGLHANQHIPQIIGALEEYKACGDPYYFKIASAFWKIVTDHYAYSIGGVGRGEIFKEPDILAGNIDTDRNCETCAMYNMLKLTRRLYEYDPENSVYMDYYERGLINQIAASQNPRITERMHHGVTYMLPIGPGAIREYSSDYDDFTCCHGTGMENHVKYQNSVYFIDEKQKIIYVNLYINSSLQSHSPMTMKVDDLNQKADLTITADSDYRLRFRVPYWANLGMIIEKNGKKICETDCPSGYLEPDCSCRRGDVFTICFPYSIRLESTPDLLEGSEVASVCYGPYVMVCTDDRQNWINLSCLPDLSDCFDVAWDAENSYPVLVYFGLRFIPMYAAHNTRYHTYFKITRI